MTSIKNFKQRYKKLNKEQKEAVDAIEGPVLVVSGPGSGKTELISLRVANILQKTDTLPSSILCLTFTESAAFNMRERLAGLIGPEAYRVAVHTFHSFGVEVINKYPEFFYKGASFSPADDLAQIELLQEIFDDLPHDNILGSKHPEQGYVYLRDTQNAIASLKKAGLTPEEFSNILNHNEKSFGHIKKQVHEIFNERLSKKCFPQIKSLVGAMRLHKSSKFPARHLRPLLLAISDSLEQALGAAEEIGKTSPLSLWKAKWLKKGDGGTRILRDEAYLPHMRALANIYAKYRERMYERGFYDFQDMLLDTIVGIENNETLRHELQEQYLYILVDEFQDTNDAQMRLLNLLADSFVHEGRPNVMVVGDDDQAIFKFQGAEISNILEFQRLYKDTKIVTLTKNYRSAQNILDVARYIIKKGDQRLENLIPQLDKTLIASKENIGVGKIMSRSFVTRDHEYYFAAREIKKLLDGGRDANEISIIARRHRDLEAVVPYLNKMGIPVRYERQQNVLHEPHIYQLIQMVRFITDLSRKNLKEVDYLLPEILSYPFWNIDRKTVWELSVRARSTRRPTPWIDCMLTSRDAHIKQLANFFLELASRATHEPLEYMMDVMIGEKFKEYYFSRESFDKDRAKYLAFLSALRVFVKALREYRHGKRIKLDDLITFVDMHEKNGIVLKDTSPFLNAQSAVQLMSAHTAKGLEFDTVFVLNCQDEVWAGRGRGNKLPFPQNLPISPAGDALDDQLRLFYVALTRSKKNLYLTSYETSDSGKSSPRLQFLWSQSAEEEVEGVLDALNYKKVSTSIDEALHPQEVLSFAWESYHQPPFIHSEKSLLTPLVENYKMSVTHLNNFLDVARGGPQLFLEQNLLRFPRPMSVSGVYGSCMHRALQALYLELKKKGKVPTSSQLFKRFESEMQRQRLSDSDLSHYLKRGKSALSAFYKERKGTFDASHEVEFDFANQGVVVEDAHITGKIDKIVRAGDDEIIVHDWKTGKAEDRWVSTPKLLNYKRQIVFYKLLIENSREFGPGRQHKDGYKVNRGVLEFVEPRKVASPPRGRPQIIDLELEIKQEDVEHLSQLIQVVYKKIKNLEFPDVSKYSSDAKGAKEFEDDLIQGNV